MDRLRKTLITIALLLTVFVVDDCPAESPPVLASELNRLTLSQLEDQVQEIDSRLRSLAPFSLRSGIGVIGYRSHSRSSRKGQEWVEISLDREYPIDEIVLVPTLSRDALNGYRSDGFPEALRVVAGTDADRTGKVVAQYVSADMIQPRIGPLVIPLQETSASWIRVEATSLSTRAFDGKYVFQLAEIMLFDGTTNVALRQKTQASSVSVDHMGVWDIRFLVDGYTPYLMDSSDDSQSIAYVSTFGERPNLYLDLKDEYPISQIHLHAVDQFDTVPQAYAGDLGIPDRLKIEGASDESFSDAKLLLDYKRENINDLGPIMMWNIPETYCKFVRVVPSPPDRSKRGLKALENKKDIRIGFAEIQLFSHDQNVALGKRAFTNHQFIEGDRSPMALTDGKNMFGEILPMRTWLNELAERHDLERRRPLVDAELNNRYALQSDYLAWVSLLAAFLAVGIAATFLIDRFLRMRQLAQFRLRFAADLHDELGADLHVIGLLSDLATAAVDSPEKLESMHQRIRTMTHRSSDAVRYCTNMLEAKGLYGDLKEDMQRSTERIMADFKGELTLVDDGNVLGRLKPRTRADLFLFYKESLVNISRHSNATHFDARLETNLNEINLTVRDDGSGLADTQHFEVPASLARRAKLLGATVTAQQSKIGGTCISLKMKTRKWGFHK